MKNLLVVTQKVDFEDDVLGFFHQWLLKLAARMDLVVIANAVGKHTLPSNVTLYSLGKERGRSRFRRHLFYGWYLFRFLPKVDGVFFHMCPEFVIGAGILPRLLRKKTLFWYTHKNVNLRLWLAEKLASRIYTASLASFRLSSRKVEIVGHGIDTEIFAPSVQKREDERLRILSAGRIAPVKNDNIMIKVAEILRELGIDFRMEIAGKPLLAQDQEYFLALRREIREKRLEDDVIFVGSIPNCELAKFYQSGDVFLNFSDTGSLDKAILEAMACGLQVLTSNEAFREILDDDHFTSKDPQEIVSKIMGLRMNGKGRVLREYVKQYHNLEHLAQKIVSCYEVS